MTTTTSEGATGQAAPSPAVTVVPETFTLVDYKAEEIADVTAALCRRIGLPADFSLRIELDETTPLGRAYVASREPAVLAVESGAFEHLHQPRQFDPARATDVLGRSLLRLRDRLDPAFGEPPADEDLSLPLSAAWDVYAVGRLGRLGYSAQRQRRLYQFRVRHGFTDDTDAAFTQLWEAERLTWAEIADLSAQATP